MSKKLAELESALTQLNARGWTGASRDEDAMTSAAAAAGNHAVLAPGRDEYSKATQTVETAFVPCEGCYLVQQSLHEVGRTTVATCEMLSLASCVARYQTTVSGLDWLSGI